MLVWPELLEPGAIMVGTYKKDMPELSKCQEKDEEKKPTAMIGLRIPYNTPLQRYGSDEIPWVASMAYDEADWMGQSWRSG